MNNTLDNFGQKLKILFEGYWMYKRQANSELFVDTINPKKYVFFESRKFP